MNVEAENVRLDATVHLPAIQRTNPPFPVITLTVQIFSFANPIFIQPPVPLHHLQLHSFMSRIDLVHLNLILKGKLIWEP
ncbi:hypothetical protein HanPI659440_Chr07g0263821 [Helianthus annuus]|nr:hypothetical protein HanPI659440_Chr07g0263821 [Helianthus annuus]